MSQDYRLEVHRRALKKDPVALCSFHVDVYYLKDLHACRHIGKSVAEAVRFEIFVDEIYPQEYWIRGANGEWVYQLPPHSIPSTEDH